MLLFAGVVGILGALYVRNAGNLEVAGLFALGGVACIVGALTGGVTSVVARVLGFVTAAAVILLIIV